jgi:hypothetical protein
MASCRGAGTNKYHVDTKFDEAMLEQSLDRRLAAAEVEGCNKVLAAARGVK